MEKNMIQSALEAAQKPFITEMPNGDPVVFSPNENGGWGLSIKPECRVTPNRKRGNIHLHTTDSLIRYVGKHREAGTAIYINADYTTGSIGVTAVLNNDTADDPGWKDHRAHYSPKLTPPAKKWLDKNGARMNQAAFAAFLTNCARDIVSRNPNDESKTYPSAAEVLDFALNLEYTEKTTFKQGYREQDGRINFTFQSEDAGKTETNLKAFERFGIAYTPYQGGDSYFVEALLKFRIDKNDGALVLWYELQHIESVTEQAAKDITDTLQTAFADMDIYFGTPA